MDLGGPVWPASIVLPGEQLEALHQVPPQPVQVLPGIVVDRALHVSHDRHPASEMQEPRTPCLAHGHLAGPRLLGGHAHVAREPGSRPGEAPEQHRRGLGDEDVRLRP